MKLLLADGVRRRCEGLGLTQVQVAERLGSSQSRVAKMEAADRTVSACYWTGGFNSEPARATWLSSWSREFGIEPNERPPASD